MIEIQLSRGLIATIDDDDLHKITPFRWYAEKDHRTFYARCSIYLGRTNGRQKFRRLSMHRLVCTAPDGIQVDHIDGNGLNNIRSNLRFSNHDTNSWNQRRPRHNTSGYKGVSFAKREGRFQAAIYKYGRMIWCGYHPTAEDAARAYDRAALAEHGAFARLNFPTQLTEKPE